MPDVSATVLLLTSDGERFSLPKGLKQVVVVGPTEIGGGKTAAQRYGSAVFPVPLCGAVGAISRTSVDITPLKIGITQAISGEVTMLDMEKDLSISPVVIEPVALPPISYVTARTTPESGLLVFNCVTEQDLACTLAMAVSNTIEKSGIPNLHLLMVANATSVSDGKGSKPPSLESVWVRSASQQLPEIGEGSGVPLDLGAEYDLVSAFDTALFQHGLVVLQPSAVAVAGVRSMAMRTGNAYKAGTWDVRAANIIQLLGSIVFGAKLRPADCDRPQLHSALNPAEGERSMYT
eukprot:Clim_evm14s46 gene=Clim_evmTU14s46